MGAPPPNLPPFLAVRALYTENYDEYSTFFRCLFAIDKGCYSKVLTASFSDLRPPDALPIYHPAFRTYSKAKLSDAGGG